MSIHAYSYVCALQVWWGKKKREKKKRNVCVQEREELRERIGLKG